MQSNCLKRSCFYNISLHWLKHCADSAVKNQILFYCFLLFMIQINEGGGVRGVLISNSSRNKSCFPDSWKLKSYERQISWNFWIKYFHLICHLNLTKINCITLKISSKADFKSKSQNIWQQIILSSRTNDMHVTQDLNSFREIIAHAHCSVDEKNVGCK